MCNDRGALQHDVGSSGSELNDAPPYQGSKNRAVFVKRGEQGTNWLGPTNSGSYELQHFRETVPLWTSRKPKVLVYASILML